uniref:Uncharacterized protein n=1 Tax=Vannella robusta TaxID=1487602 RepID=A0A7S4HLR8_9EUKA
MGGAESHHYRPEPWSPHKSEKEYAKWRASRTNEHMAMVKKNYEYYVRAAFVARDDYMYRYMKRVDILAKQQNVSFKGKMTPAHAWELKGYFKNPYEALLGEMEGTMVKVTHNLHMPAGDYGDRPVYIEELHKDDKRIYGDTTWFHENLDKTDSKKYAVAVEE